MMNIRTKLTAFAVLLSGLSFVILSLIDRYELKGLRFGFELLVPVLILSGMMMYGYADKLMNRVERTRSKMGLIIKGKYQFDVKPIRNDEIGRLEEELDKLAHYNASLIRRGKKEAHTIQTLLSGMKEGVVILDQFGRIIMINAAAEEMFGRSQRTVEEKPLMSLMRNKELDEFVNKILEGNNEGSIEFELKECTYTSWVSILTDEEVTVGVVLVLRDVTELRRLEKMRTEFVANVSHELRTPLTSIKGFVETLLDGASEDKEVRERFLKIIQSESLRLQHIIDDLLTLSRIENRHLGKKGEAQKFGFIQNAFEKIRPVIESYAEAKGLEIKAEIPAELPYVLMGEDLLSQVLLNLMENAVKYTSSGYIALSCKAEDAVVAVEIRDTGCGIPKENLGRIFERFYRVDKARSREIGGTGLGLSIVKHIVEVVEGELLYPLK
jgi:two-component system phosphate regulon sensor histidine kinase PhoR